jgi:hypothetical protein
MGAAPVGTLASARRSVETNKMVATEEPRGGRPTPGSRLLHHRQGHDRGHQHAPQRVRRAAPAGISELRGRGVRRQVAASGPGMRSDPAAAVGRMAGAPARALAGGQAAAPPPAARNSGGAGRFALPRLEAGQSADPPELAAAMLTASNSPPPILPARIRAGAAARSAGRSGPWSPGRSAPPVPMPVMDRMPVRPTCGKPPLSTLGAPQALAPHPSPAQRGSDATPSDAWSRACPTRRRGTCPWAHPGLVPRPARPDLGPTMVASHTPHTTPSGEPDLPRRPSWRVVGARAETRGADRLEG